LKITAWKAQRLYTNNPWPNPVVVKITHATTGPMPSRVETLTARGNAANKTVVVSARLGDLGKAARRAIPHQPRGDEIHFASVANHAFDDAQCDWRIHH